MARVCGMLLVTLLFVFPHWPWGSRQPALSVGTHFASCWTLALHVSTKFTLIDVGRIGLILADILRGVFDRWSDGNSIVFHFHVTDFPIIQKHFIALIKSSFTHLKAKTAFPKLERTWCLLIKRTPWKGNCHWFQLQCQVYFTTTNMQLEEC